MAIRPLAQSLSIFSLISVSPGFSVSMAVRLELGVVYAVASVLIITLAEWADGGALDELMQVLADAALAAADRA